jgi:hypothetical protein
MTRIETLQFIGRNAPARILSVSGSDWAAEHNSMVLLLLGQGFLSLTEQGLVVSEAGRQEIDTWQAQEDARYSAKGA